MLSNLGIVGILPLILILVLIGFFLRAIVQVRKNTRETSRKLDQILMLLSKQQED